MKLQVDSQTLRFRLSEAELAGLLRGGSCEDGLRLGDGRVALRAVHLVDDSVAPDLSGDLMDLRATLPRAGFQAFAVERPRRDGFSFTATCGVAVSVEIDVRDSHRMTQVKRKGESAAGIDVNQ